METNAFNCGLLDEKTRAANLENFVFELFNLSINARLAFFELLKRALAGNNLGVQCGDPCDIT